MVFSSLASLASLACVADSTSLVSFLPSSKSGAQIALDCASLIDEYEFMFMLQRLRGVLAWGLALWALGTIGLRLGGRFLLPTARGGWTLLLLIGSIPLMASVARRLCQRARLPADQWPAGALALMLPTLLLDAFAAAFFPAVYPGLAPDAAGVFGGWMLACCAGAALGGGTPPRTR
jgi:hypothetical protein